MKEVQLLERILFALLRPLDELPDGLLGARTAPSVARNREPILEVLKAHLPATGLVLEIASGTGEHAVGFAQALPQLMWRPTDAESPPPEEE